MNELTREIRVNSLLLGIITVPDLPQGLAAYSIIPQNSFKVYANDPYKALKMTLKAEIDREAWESLHSDASRAFDRPRNGRIAVKVINHLGDEVMKVFSV